MDTATKTHFPLKVPSMVLDLVFEQVVSKIISFARLWGSSHFCDGMRKSQAQQALLFFHPPCRPSLIDFVSVLQEAAVIKGL